MTSKKTILMLNLVNFLMFDLFNLRPIYISSLTHSSLVLLIKRFHVENVMESFMSLNEIDFLVKANQGY